MKPMGMRTFLAAGILLAALLLVAAPAAAAKTTTTTIGYLSIPGVTDGCSDVRGYENSCLVYGYEQGVTNTVSSPGGGGGGAGRAELSLSVTKPVDRASVKILGDAVTGTHIRDATLRLARDGSFTNAYRIQLSDVLITGVRQYYDPLDPDQAGAGQLEEVTLGFEKIEWVWEPDLAFCFSLSENRLC